MLTYNIHTKFQFNRITCLEAIVLIHIHAHTHAHACTHTCTDIHTHMHRYTHTHTYIHYRENILYECRKSQNA